MNILVIGLTEPTKLGEKQTFQFQRRFSQIFEYCKYQCRSGKLTSKCTQTLGKCENATIKNEFIRFLKEFKKSRKPTINKLLMKLMCIQTIILKETTKRLKWFCGRFL